MTQNIPDIDRVIDAALNTADELNQRDNHHAVKINSINIGEIPDANTKVLFWSDDFDTWFIGIFDRDYNNLGAFWVPIPFSLTGEGVHIHGERWIPLPSGLGAVEPSPVAQEDRDLPGEISF